MGHLVPPTPLPDNGVPGPGTYQQVPNKSIPGFKIVNATQLNEKQENLKKQQEGKPQVGPWSYTPAVNSINPQKGVLVGTAIRKEDNSTNRFTPAPNRY